MIRKLAIILGCILLITPTAEAATHTPKIAKIQQVNLAKVLWRDSARGKLQDAVTSATKRVHRTSYVFAGSTIYGWDCSGLVRWVYRKAGLTLPHSADKQGHLGQRVSIPKRGDIVVFAYRGSTDFYHAAIYLGSGLILHANREYGTTVIEPLDTFKDSQIRFIRVL